MEINVDSKMLKVKLDIETLLKDLGGFRESLLKVITRPASAWSADVGEDGELNITVRKSDQFKVIRVDKSGRIAVYSRTGQEFQG